VGGRHIDASFNYLVSRKIGISKEELKDLYLNKKLTTFQIADKFRCCQATIWKRLREFKIEARLPGIRRVNIPNHVLKKLYLKEKLSSWKIEKKLGIPRSTVHRKLKEAGIIKDRATAHIVYQRNNFSGNLVEKAYLIGFRIGDLGVRRIWPNSKTITVASGSTIQEQINLIKRLFRGYGKIWVKEAKNGKINIQVSLNESFSFLLNKEIPHWLLKKKKHFFAFLAGFTDAEGNIGLNNKMAYYNFGNCSLEILSQIKATLTKFKIRVPNISTDKRKGKPTTGGYFFSSNYHQLRINKKDDLTNLFRSLKGHIKHENKIKALNRAIENIEWRNIRYEK